MDQTKLPRIRRPLKIADVEALPVANDKMTNEELRKLVTDYAVMQGSFRWTPSRDLVFHCPGARASDADGNLCFPAGGIYGGVPYTHAGHDLMNFLEYYDEKTGVIDVDALGDRPEKVVGSDCANALFWAWARVSATLSYILTRYMTQANGCLKLGPYTYPASVADFRDLYTKKICKDNGEQTMFESYALLEPADGLVLYVGRGHGMMALEKAVAVRREDGTIDGEESYVYIVEQHSPITDLETEDGTVHNVGGIRNKKTFAQLFKEGNVPFRIPELAGLAPVQKAWIKTSLPKEDLQMEDLFHGTVLSNYVFSRVDAVAESGGKEIFHLTGFGRVSRDSRRFRLDDLDWPEDLPVPEARLTITARLANGETLTAYEGKVIAAPPVPTLKGRITKADFDALPVANDSMTEAELRDLVVRYALMQATVTWTPSDTVYYRCPGVYSLDLNKNLVFHRGTVYGGTPYSVYKFDAYCFLDHLDENGVLPTRKLGMDLMKILGNHCSSALFWAWARVSSRLTYTYTCNMLPKFGCLRLGDYHYDETVDNFVQYGTSRICKENGEQKMFEAYALLLPADGMVFTVRAVGHSCLIVQKPCVARREDGTIDGEKSAVEVVEQTTILTDRETENGTVKRASPNRLTFAEIFQKGFIPFRIPEFCGQKVEKAKFETGEESDLRLIYTPDELRNLKVTCNYPISQVWITVKPFGGEPIVITRHATVDDCRALTFADRIPDGLPVGKLTVTARAGNGEIHTLFEGKLEAAH